MSARDDAFSLKLMATFKIEAEEHLKNLNAGLLKLEKGSSSKPCQEDVQNIFREAHSLKGAARAVNQDAIQLLFQALENVLAGLKQEKIGLSQELFDSLYASIDLASSLLQSEQAAVAKANLAKMIQRLDNLLSPLKTPPLAKVSASEVPLPADTLASAANETSLPADTFKTEEKLLTKDHLQASLQSKLNEHVEKPAEEHAPFSNKSASSSLKPAHEPLYTREDHTVRVASSKLDRLFQQAEELLMIKLNALQQLTSFKKMEKLLLDWKKDSGHLAIDIQNQYTSNSKDEALLRQFFDKNHQFIQALNEILYPLSQSTNLDYRFFGGLIDALLEDAKSLLMQPFATILESFPRMVRDLAHQLNKNVQLEIQGADIEIDRRILEQIKDPLIHCVRNSIDHGICLPEQRKAKGKSEMGTIKIIASQPSSNSIEIVISDDGAGLNTEAIRQSAIKQKMLSQKEADNLSEQEIQKFIFYSGLSTSKIVTEVSGRGLGMNIVAEKADKLGGQVTVESSPQGTAIRFSLPLTLATFRGIQLKIAGYDFIMPTHNVQRVVRVHQKEIKSVENRAMLAIDGHAYAYAHLGDILGIAKLENEAPEFITVLIVKAAEQSMAFGVDAVINEQEVLVKRFGKQLTHVKNILSATVIEMGKVVPILNPTDLVRTSTRDSRPLPNIALQNSAQENKMRRILLAEDSVTTRMLLKNILESANFEVFVAVDGAEALKILKDTQVDILLTDVEMPNMDGFTLTENIRKNEALKDLPVILCTSLNSTADRERGIEVGAQAHIDKSSFTQSYLLNVIEKLL